MIQDQKKKDICSYGDKRGGEITMMRRKRATQMPLRHSSAPNGGLSSCTLDAAKFVSENCKRKIEFL